VNRGTGRSRLDHQAGLLRDAEGVELVDVRIELERGPVNLARKRKNRHIDDEFPGVADVDERVFQRHTVGPI
jgi:hypothetical protein